MWPIIINIIGIFVCVGWLFYAITEEQVGSAILAFLLLCLNTGLLAINIDKKNHPEKFNVTIIETKTPPTIDTLILRGAVPDTTYVITTVNAKVR